MSDSKHSQPQPNMVFLQQQEPSKQKVLMQAIEKALEEWKALQSYLAKPSFKCLTCRAQTDAPLCKSCYDFADEDRDYDTLDLHNQGLAFNSSKILAQEYDVMEKIADSWRDYALWLENKLALVKKDRVRLRAQLRRK